MVMPAWLRACALALAIVVCTPWPCGAQPASEAAEYQVKAAFLYKFLGFVEWPSHAFERAGSALVIGVLGSDLLATELAQVVGNRQADGRPIRTQQHKPEDSVAGLHVLFVSRSETSRVASIAAAAKGRSLLIVTEAPDGLVPGSSINFVVVENKVRFDVALRTAEEAQLKISSRLLAVARRVIAHVPLENAAPAFTASLLAWLPPTLMRRPA